MKNLFGELKKVLDKEDDDVVFPNSKETVGDAREADSENRFVSCLFRAWATSIRDFTADPRMVTKNQFVNFCKFILQKDINDTGAQDLYMSLQGKLKGLLSSLQTPN